MRSIDRGGQASSIFISALICSVLAGFISFGAIASPDLAVGPDVVPSGWSQLLHLRRGKLWQSFGGLSSDVDDPAFFLSGTRDPQKEFAAMLAIFRAEQSRAPLSTDALDDKVLDAQVACRFPARYRFFRERVAEAKNWKSFTCPRFSTFRDGVNAESTTLIFSAYYLNNPSSAFGHTFLRLNKRAPAGTDAGGSARKAHPLLDYGLGFAASPGSVDPLTFAIGGLFGWFIGEFTSTPYYLKVQEYNNVESRDLWEYDLKLTPDEIALLVDHLWELGNAKNHYRYLSVNCSSLMLTALEAAAPRLDLIDRLPYWIIPADTVRVLYEIPGLVSSYRYRPSKRSQFLAQFDRRTASEQKEITAIIRSGEIAEAAEKLSGPTAVSMVDTLIDYIDFRYFRKIVEEDPEVTKLKQRTLIARSRLGVTPLSDRVVASEPVLEKPQWAHDSARSSVGWLTSRGGEQSFLLGQRFALHDFLDSQRGYPRDSEIKFLDFQLRVLQQNADGRSRESAVRFEHAYMVGVTSFAPYERLLPNVSWKVRLGLERTWDGSCTECLAGVFGGGVGYTADLYAGRVLATLLLTPDLSLSSEFKKSAFKFRLGSEFNLRLIFDPRWIAMVNAQYFHFFLVAPGDAYRFTEEVRWTAPSYQWALGAAVHHLPRGDVEMRGQFFYYW